jgi:hypothetical protein
MLHACHDRVRRSLDLLGRVCERLVQGRVDAAVHDAAADVLRYFDRAAPQHHEDEEAACLPARAGRGRRAGRTGRGAPPAAGAPADAGVVGAAARPAGRARRRRRLGLRCGAASTRRRSFRALYEAHAQHRGGAGVPARRRLLDAAATGAPPARDGRAAGVVPPQENGE